MKKELKEGLTAAQQVESLLGTAKQEISDEATKKMVRAIKLKLIERQTATKILSNINREIDSLKLELAQELESL